MNEYSNFHRVSSERKKNSSAFIFLASFSLSSTSFAFRVCDRAQCTHTHTHQIHIRYVCDLWIFGKFIFRGIWSHAPPAPNTNEMAHTTNLFIESSISLVYRLRLWNVYAWLKFDGVVYICVFVDITKHARKSSHPLGWCRRTSASVIVQENHIIILLDSDIFTKITIYRNHGSYTHSVCVYVWKND